MQNVPNIVRDRLKAATPVSHPDADTLTAFSERLLSEAERARILEHLAQCGDCREVVALALPENETPQPVLGSSGSRWLAWPTLRWAFVAAGIAIASVGVVEYQHHAHNPAMMAYQASSPKAEAVAKNAQTLPAVTTPQPAQDRDKATAALVAKNEAAPAEPGPENARTSVSRRNQLHGFGYGMTLGGPVSSNQAPSQWQQQNTVQNQVAVSTPSGNATSDTAEVAGAAPSTSPQAAPFNAQLAKNQLALSGGSAGLAVDKAKLPVPPASPADGMLKRQSPQDQFRKLSPQPVPGEIGGYVVDPSGAVVSNARITITPTQTGGKSTAITNSQGAWLIAGLPSGSYKARAEAPGFKTTILDLNYDGNQPAMFSFTLSPGSVSETVEVSSAQMQVQTEGASIAAPVTALAVSPSPARALNLEQASNLSPAPRWSINAAGTLQRSFDQGSTWQDVNVAGTSPALAGNLDVAADTASAKDAKVARAKTKAAGKKGASSPVFRAVIANGSDVWAGGLHGSLYHSTDSGNRWTQVVPSSAGSVLTGDIVSIEFPDPQHGKLMTFDSRNLDHRGLRPNMAEAVAVFRDLDLGQIPRPEPCFAKNRITKVTYTQNEPHSIFNSWFGSSGGGLPRRPELKSSWALFYCSRLFGQRTRNTIYSSSINLSPIFSARGSQPNETNPTERYRRRAATCVAATESNICWMPSIAAPRSNRICNIFFPTPAPRLSGVTYTPQTRPLWRVFNPLSR